MTALNKQALTDEAISQAFTGTNFGRDDLKNILSETVIDAAAGWRCGHTATTICAQLGLLTATGRASALGLRFVSEHVQRETKRLKDELEAAEKRIDEISASHSKLRDTIATIHNTIRMDGGYTPLAAILNAAKRAYDESASAAGIGVNGE
ncbi:hypothetical protein R2X23_10555 [Citrobacter braakii]|uniref:hypothetical protein n=1 Tax=Citrobacter braakii TaxID=57706 RepID=UPI0024E0AFD8|nr:hypothetical protein [Citrobacter braakii]WOR27080.1 hypothetical protein R2X23_10555 [Citrobacter braakii]